MDLTKCEPLTLLTALVWGEARGESLIGKIAVCFVVKTRKTDPRRWPHTWNDVILQPQQFSCFNDTSKHQDLLRNRWESLSWRECRLAAYGVLHDFVVHDPTNGANHYFAILIPKNPDWSKDQTPMARIGGHLFYRL